MVHTNFAKGVPNYINFGTSLGAEEALKAFRKYTFRVVPEHHSGLHYEVVELKVDPERNKSMPDNTSVLSVNYKGTIRDELFNDGAFLVNIKKNAKFFTPLNIIPEGKFMVVLPEDRHLFTVSGVRALATAYVAGMGPHWPFWLSKSQSGFVFDIETDAILVQSFVIADEDQL